MKQISKVGKVFLRQIIRKQIVDRSIDNRDNIHNGSIIGNKAKSVSIGSRLSKLQIQLAIYLHSLEVDSNGIIHRMYYKEAAKALKCTERSIRNNIAILHRRYIIDYTEINNLFCSVLLPAYSTYHLEGYKGGEGYIDVPEFLMKELLACRNINEIRLAIIQLLNLDKQRLKQERDAVTERIEQNESEVTTIININEFKYGMPNYLNSASKIKELVKEVSFTQIEYLENRKVKVSLHSRYNYINYRERLAEEYAEMLQADLEFINAVFNSKQMNDLIQMCIQYSYEEVINAIIVFDSEVFNTEYDKVDKYCGYIRNIIKEQRFFKERVA